MEKYIEQISTTFSNPFIVSIVIVLVIILLIFFMLKPKAGRKTYFRSIFYMWLSILGIMYLHNNAINYGHKQSMNNNMNLQLINKTGSFEELTPTLDTPVKNHEPINIFEDELI